MEESRRIRQAASLPEESGAAKKRLADTAITPDKYHVVKSGVDSFLLFVILILLAFGLIMVFSASYADAESRYGDSYYFIKRQCVMVVIGLVFMVIASRIPLRMYKKFGCRGVRCVGFAFDCRIICRR